MPTSSYSPRSKARTLFERLASEEMLEETDSTQVIDVQCLRSTRRFFDESDSKRSIGEEECSTSDAVDFPLHTQESDLPVKHEQISNNVGNIIDFCEIQGSDCAEITINYTLTRTIMSWKDDMTFVETATIETSPCSIPASALARDNLVASNEGYRSSEKVFQRIFNQYLSHKRRFVLAKDVFLRPQNLLSNGVPENQRNMILIFFPKPALVLDVIYMKYLMLKSLIESLGVSGYFDSNFTLEFPKLIYMLQRAVFTRFKMITTEFVKFLRLKIHEKSSQNGDTFELLQLVSIRPKKIFVFMVFIAVEMLFFIRLIQARIGANLKFRESFQ